eukprot:3475421-Prymnesium_polylepis.1
MRSLGTFASASGYKLADVDDPQLSGTLAPTEEQAQNVLSATGGVLAEMVEEEIALAGWEPAVLARAQVPAAAAKPPPEGFGSFDAIIAADRQLCDHCSSTIFLYYRACGQCGFEACLPCIAEWQRRGRVPPNVAQSCGHSTTDWTLCSRVDLQLMRCMQRISC